MTAQDVLAVCEGEGIKLRLINGEIRAILPPSTELPDELRRAIEEHEAELGLSIGQTEPIPLRPEADGARQFTTFGPDDLKAMPPLQFRIEDWIPEGGLVGIIGKSGDMKTFVALDLAFSIATDRTWNGCGVRTGGVLYVAAEGRSGMGQRIAAWETARSRTLDNERFRLITDAPQLPTAEHVAALIATAKRWNAEVIFLDTLARTMDGDENSTRDMSAYVTACNRIQRETGATVVIVHHMGWNGERQRGSSAFFAALDAEITVTKDGDTVTTKVTKAKDFSCGAEIAFTPRIVHVPNRGSSVVLDRSDASTPELTAVARKIGKILWETFGEGGATQSEWKAVCEDLKIAERSFYFGRTALVAGGYITDPAGRTRGHRYTITDAFAPFLTKKSDEGAIGAVTLTEGATAPLEGREDRCKGAAAPLGAAPLHLSPSAPVKGDLSDSFASEGAIPRASPCGDGRPPNDRALCVTWLGSGRLALTNDELHAAQRLLGGSYTSIAPDFRARLAEACGLPPSSDPEDDDLLLWTWIGDVQTGRADTVPEDVRQAAQRLGFTFDAFAPIPQEAGRFGAHLDAREGAR